MKNFIWILTILLACTLTACLVTKESGQGEAYQSKPELRYEDHIYVDNIRTAQLYRGLAQGSYPVLYLGETIPLTLEFDELISADEMESQFWVELVACDWNWQPALVLPIEFYEGYSRDRIDFFRRSEFTKVDYVHYAYSFPQEGEGFKMSGNYIIKVFRNGDDRDLVLSKRFVVSDRKAAVSNAYVIDPNLERMLLSQLRFDVSVSGLNIFNPTNDLNVLVLQNFRWDNAFHILRPRFIRERGLEYMVDLNRAYTGGGEFRHLDLRSTRLYGRTTESIEEFESHYQVYLFKDKTKKSNFIIQYPDINGTYFIGVNEWDAPGWQADYLQTLFTLDMPFPYDSSEVYVYGGLTDWTLQERFKMAYNNDFNRYEANVQLKQGMYDYQYVVKHPDRPRLDESTLEGEPDEDENFYTVLVYYRAPGDRKHQLIGLQPLNYRN